MDELELQECQKAIHEFVEKRDFEEAMPLIYSVLEYYPDDGATLHMLGFIYLESGREAWAYQMFRRALQEAPGKAEVWTSVGRAYHELTRYEDALRCFLKAAEINPEYTLAYSNASATLVQMSDWDGTIKTAQLALETSPNDLNANMNIAHAYLAKGEWVKGWKAWGLSLGGKFRKEWTYGEEPRWDGSPGKRLVIYGEQGIGDEMFYGSCIPDAIATSQKVWIDCDPKLEGLFRRSFPKAEVHGTRREEGPKWVRNASIEARCSVGGLPEFFRKTDKDFPGSPYLVADPERVMMWKALFKSWGGKVVGITTHGGGKHTNKSGRNIPFNCWVPLLRREGYHFVSLDYQPEDTELDEELNEVKLHKFPWAASSQDYDDTAGLIAALDMVIGVNTAALHCSSAMGIKTLCLVPKYFQWRYARPYMPWYRSMRLCSQVGTWAETLDSLVWD